MDRRLAQGLYNASLAGFRSGCAELPNLLSIHPLKALSDRTGLKLSLVASALFFLAVTATSCARWANFEYRTFDLAFYVQGIWQFLHGRFDVSVLQVPLLGNHVEPIVFLLAPLFFARAASAHLCGRAKCGPRAHGADWVSHRAKARSGSVRRSADRCLYPARSGRRLRRAS